MTWNNNCTKSIPKLFYFFIKKYIPKVILICLVGIAIHMQSSFVSNYINSKFQTNLISAVAINNFSFSSVFDHSGIYYPLFLLLLNSSAISIFKFIGNILYAKVLPRLERDIRVHIMEYIMKFNISVFYHYNEGYITNCIDVLAEEMCEMLKIIIGEIIPNAAYIIIYLFVLFSISHKLFYFILIWSIVHFGFSVRFSTIAVKYSKLKSKVSNQRNALVNESFHNILTIKLYNLYKYIFNRVYTVHNVESSLRKKYITLDSYGYLLTSFIGILLQSLFIFYLLNQYSHMPRESIFNIIYNSVSFISCIKEITGKAVYLIEHAGNILQSLSFINYNKRKIKEKGQDTLLTGAIDFHNFSYTNSSNRSIIKNLNGSIKAGDIVSIFGLSGSGKSTILNILTRLIDIQYDKNSRISLDNVFLGKINYISLRNQMAFISQRSQIFSQSVKENIMLGNLASTKEDIEYAINKACLDGVINNLPNGADTIIEPNYSNISVGQAQRISIARAFLHNNLKILLADEITSALDPVNSKFIIDIIAEYCRSKKVTVLIASHFPYLSSISDKIIFLGKDKTILDTHSNLIKNNKEYSTFISS